MSVVDTNRADPKFDSYCVMNKIFVTFSLLNDSQDIQRDKPSREQIVALSW